MQSSIAFHEIILFYRFEVMHYAFMTKQSLWDFKHKQDLFAHRNA